MLEMIKGLLGYNFREEDSEVLQNILKLVTSDALSISNGESEESLQSYIVEATISEYLRRGTEGTTSKSEGGQSSSYIDIKEKMRNDIIRDGKRHIF